MATVIFITLQTAKPITMPCKIAHKSEKSFQKTHTSDLSSLLLVLSEPSFFFFAFFSLRFSLLLLRNPANRKM
jgi:hypothetical protein